MNLSTVKTHKKGILLAAAFILLFALAGTVLLYLVYIPKKFSEYVTKYSAEYGVEEELAFAVIRAESNFRADAVSSAGARGLMQLMPSTAQFISECIGESLDIDEPQDNIRMGIWYIAYLQEKFGEAETALAAYNAGEGAVRQWLRDGRYSEDGRTLVAIPLKETANYVQRVKKFYKCYKILYF